ncbi:MAG TPA: hypothetical protein VII72_12420 [Myxococcota bacterium]|jgi:hypothetical protein
MRSLILIVSLVPLLARPAFAADGAVLPLSPKDQAEITKVLGPNVVGQALPSKTITDASVLFPLEEKSAVYHVTSGKNAGKQQTLHVKKGKNPAGSAAWRFELSPTLASFISQGPEGDLVMPAVTDSDEGVIVVTTPANPFVLEGMTPGESRPLSQKVSVNYLDDPTDQRYAGSLTGTYTYVGNYQLTVPAGSFPALLIRLDYSGKVGPAHTQDTAYYFFAPGVGVVAMISQEDVEAYWIIHIDTTTGKVLARP